MSKQLTEFLPDLIQISHIIPSFAYSGLALEKYSQFLKLLSLSLFLLGFSVLSANPFPSLLLFPLAYVFQEAFLDH